MSIEKLTLWEKIKKKFFNNWIGVIIILIAGGMTYFILFFNQIRNVTGIYEDHLKTSECDTIIKDLIVHESKMIQYLNSKLMTDSIIHELLHRYILKRKNLNYLECKIPRDLLLTEESLKNKINVRIFSMGIKKNSLIKQKHNKDIRNIASEIKIYGHLMNDFCDVTNICSSEDKKMYNE